ncbi:MAG: hypothetical protein GX781_06100 [Clostridiales bacterium]|nr:hypothetical protein [Clostridiales bacterium]
MRKLIVFFSIIFCLLVQTPVNAEEQVILPVLPAVVLLPQGVYSPVLTPDNLQENQAFIFSRGGTVEQWQEEFKNSGILLKAYDDSNKRVLQVTGLLDEDGQRYGDIDLQSPATRAQYRSLYKSDGPFAQKGYRVESAEWKNFKSIGRFLMMRYSFRQDGEVIHRGFARRSVKNGLSVMVDMQVYDRTLSAGDNTALNKVFDTLSFTGSVGVGAAATPIFLNESASAPLETNQPSFTLKGMTRAGAKLTATVMSFTSTTPANFSVQADEKGNYSLPIQLSSEGIYMMNLSVQAEGLDPLEKTYSITYGRNLLPVQITLQLPEIMTQDKYTISGITQAGVNVQMILNGDNTSKRTAKNGSFSFNVNTKAEGIYQLRLIFEKKGFDARTFDFTAVKGSAQQSSLNPDNAANAVPLASQGEAVSPSYTELVAKADIYDGMLLTYDGFITRIEEQAGDYILSIALRKTATGFADTIKAVMDKAPDFTAQDKVRVYGLLEGIGSGEDASIDLSYPMLRVQSLTLLEKFMDPDA